MYEELISRLKNLAMLTTENGKSEIPFSAEAVQAIREIATEAADAIEELSHRETPMKITEIHVDEYYCPACRAENNCDEGDVQDTYCPACGQRLLPEPPKEEG